jgi:multisubunit Na+/H+ antiporter MnhC subunit
MALADVLILIAVVIDIVVTSYILLSYIRHRAITKSDAA